MHKCNHWRHPPQEWMHCSSHLENPIFCCFVGCSFYFSHSATCLDLKPTWLVLTVNLNSSLQQSRHHHAKCSNFEDFVLPNWNSTPLWLPSTDVLPSAEASLFLSIVFCNSATNEMVFCPTGGSRSMRKYAQSEFPFWKFLTISSPVSTMLICPLNLKFSSFERILLGVFSN